MVKLATLQPGTRFLYPSTGKTAVVVSQGNGGTRILYDSATRQVTFTSRTLDGEKEVTFESPGSALVVSSGSDVEVVK